MILILIWAKRLRPSSFIALHCPPLLGFSLARLARSSRPRNRGPSQMALPRELNDTDPVPRLLGLDRERRSPADRVDDVFVEPQPATGRRRVGGAVCL